MANDGEKRKNPNELTKAQTKIAKDIIKKGILRRHQEWLDELSVLVQNPIPEGENAYDRSMTITKMAHDFYQEAMRLEEFYRTSQLPFAIMYLLGTGYLTPADLNGLPDSYAALLIALSHERFG